MTLQKRYNYPKKASAGLSAGLTVTSGRKKQKKRDCPKKKKEKTNKQESLSHRSIDHYAEEPYDRIFFSVALQHCLEGSVRAEVHIARTYVCEHKHSK